MRYSLKIILSYPYVILLLLGVIVGSLGLFIGDFRLDISSESLVLEHDEDLEYYRAIGARYGSDDFVLVTYTPHGDLFSDATLNDLSRLQDELLQLERVESVTSILNAPLLQSPPMSFSELQDDFRTLRDPDTDFQLAQHELRESPLYNRQLMSDDGRTTVLQVLFERDEAYHRLREERDELRAIQLERTLTAQEASELQEGVEKFSHYSDELGDEQASDIRHIRRVLDAHRDKASIHLGGVPMIVTDMMSFIRHDLNLFGWGVLLAMFILLSLIFRKPRWVLLPLVTAGITVFAMLGTLGLIGWRITIVSSNFVSLLLIFSISITVHLIVRYRELAYRNPSWNQLELVSSMMISKLPPCFYTVATTVVAFSSLIVSGIRPVIDFGWIMSLGLCLAFFFAFTFFPACLVLLPRSNGVPGADFTGRLASGITSVVQRRGRLILLLSFVFFGVSIVGILRLTVENKFIDYFHSSTEIHTGMQLIDLRLGGTTPLDVIVDAPADFEMVTELDEFEDEFNGDSSRSLTETSYWFNEYMLGELEDMHRYLESLPHTGKVLSLATGIQVLKSLNKGQSLDTFELGVLYGRLPEETKSTLISPYLSDDGRQVRFTVRLSESYPELEREQFLRSVHQYLVEQYEIKPSNVHLTGMAVLYNNMLQSLFRSQILTLGTVFLAILIAFAVVLRSFKLAAIAIFPNTLSALLVLGFMGIAGVPLDIMTITIAAISVGIAVDDTIHYMHRYGEEIQKGEGYRSATRNSHATIGRAMYYTSLTIMIGFSILVFSNFIPTIYFGLLTACAMFMALLANLFLLPVLLERLKPYPNVEDLVV